MTRHGKPDARLVRVQPRRSIPSHRSLRESMPKMHKESETLVREDQGCPMNAVVYFDTSAVAKWYIVAFHLQSRKEDSPMFKQASKMAAIVIVTELRHFF